MRHRWDHHCYWRDIFTHASETKWGVVMASGRLKLWIRQSQFIHRHSGAIHDTCSMQTGKCHGRYLSVWRSSLASIICLLPGTVSTRVFEAVHLAFRASCNASKEVKLVVEGHSHVAHWGRREERTRGGGKPRLLSFCSWGELFPQDQTSRRVVGEIVSL